MKHDSTVLSLFAGIGGFEQAFRKSGFSGDIISYENWAPARTVHANRFPRAHLFNDVQDMPANMHDADIVTAGFPCTDLSSAGRQAGIGGEASGLIVGVLEAIRRQSPEWVLLENVPNMLRLNAGEAMSIVGDLLSRAGYKWAYRILDAQNFGVAQRRKRVFILASRRHDPARVLFRDYFTQSKARGINSPKTIKAHGFYWTEGNRGVGWGDGVVPTIKGSTTAGIPSAPAVWLPSMDIDLRFRTPSIESLETLQGFRPGWTKAAPARDRWKLVGNAVAVPVVKWIADGLAGYSQLESVDLAPEHDVKQGWGTAGISTAGAVRCVKVSDGPATGSLRRTFSLFGVLEERGSHPLSAKATRGFASRLQRSSLRYQDSFMRDLEAYASL